MSQPSNQDGQTTCPTCGGEGGHYIASRRFMCHTCGGTGTVPSNPADSLEQEIRDILRPLYHGVNVVEPYQSKLSALVRHREIAAVEAFAERVKRKADAVAAFPPALVIEMKLLDAVAAKWKEGEKENGRR